MMKIKYVNYNKIQVEILKNPSNYKAGEYSTENQEYVTFTDGFVLFFIPKKCCFLDPTKFNSVDMQKLVDPLLSVNRERAELSPILKKERTRTILKFVTSTTRAYINEKYIKMFPNCDIEIAEREKPIIATSMGLLVGLAMPVRVFESEEW